MNLRYAETQGRGKKERCVRSAVRKRGDMGTQSPPPLPPAVAMQL